MLDGKRPGRGGNGTRESGVVICLLIFLTVAVAGCEGLEGGEVRLSMERTSPSSTHAVLVSGNNSFAFDLYQSL